MASLKAVIFDMDGTLVDNMQYHRRAWDVFLKRKNIFLDEQAFSKIAHGTINEIMARVFPGLSEKAVVRLGEEKEQIYRELYAPEIRPIPGLLTFLAQLHRERIPIGLATMGNKLNQSMILTSLNIENYFDTLVGGEDVTNGKPDPEVFIKAAENLHVDAAACLAFEDTFGGIKAAKLAGMKTVAIATTHTVEELKPCNPDVILADYTSCPPSLLYA